MSTDDSLVRVTRGDPDDDELAALTVVLAAMLAEPEPARQNTDRPMAGGWNSYWRRVREPFVHGPEAWRGSLR
ncbi:hypothetical protein GCM10009785_04490 [Brooklawnia cerclae]|uniref:Acyl-CoA carboxylase subunit epsilon n=1 Tax=Brooklawnia cerclae TaxID=349934 RepID=A0ABX0SCA5_9ACTN|nr:hypothetical protein [Brooklawnia cerclae]